MQKTKNSHAHYWNAAGMLLWIVIFLLGIYVSKHEMNNSIQIPSVLLLCLYLFRQLIRWGLMDKTIVKYRNVIFASAYSNAKRKKDGLEEVEKITKEDFRKSMEEKNDWIIYPFIVLYMSLVLVSLFI